MKSELSLCGLTIALGGALFCQSAKAQPAVQTEPKRIVTPPLSLAELEKLIGGRTTLTLNLKDATLEEAAAAISASSGLKIQVRPKPVFTRPTGAPAYEPPPEPRYTFEAKGEPFWESFLSWQRAAREAQKAKPAQPDIVLPDGRVIPRRVNPDLGLFQFQKISDADFLEAGNPLLEGRTLVSWPYVMVGTRLTRTQQANLDEEGLLPLYEAPKTRLPLTLNGVPATSVAPKPPPTEAERWLDGLTLNAQTYLDPKIKPLNLRCEVEEAIDDKGNDLREITKDTSISPNFFTTRTFSNGSNNTALTVPLRSLPSMGKKLIKLRGTLRFTIVTRTQHWETSDLEKATVGDLWGNGGNFATQFKGLKSVGDMWQVAFSAQSEGESLRRLYEQYKNSGWSAALNPFGTLSIFGGFGGSSSSVQVQIIDDAGEIFTSSGSSYGARLGPIDGSQPAKTVTPGDSPLPADVENGRYTEDMTRNFSKSIIRNGKSIVMGRPVKIILNLPVERREVVIPFEFTNLPLPPTATAAR